MLQHGGTGPGPNWIGVSRLRSVARLTDATRPRSSGATPRCGKQARHGTNKSRSGRHGDVSQLGGHLTVFAADC